MGNFGNRDFGKTESNIRIIAENMVFANQQAYYDAIEQFHIRDSQPFIDFMLQEILNTLEDNKEMAINEINNTI